MEGITEPVAQASLFLSVPKVPCRKHTETVHAAEELSGSGEARLGWSSPFALANIAEKSGQQLFLQH